MLHVDDLWAFNVPEATLGLCEVLHCSAAD